ncbi:MAG: C40 family peptidase [Flavisolibacter sp.]|nr:C40 family peptidase [Flavisolibacter sp.]
MSTVSAQKAIKSKSELKFIEDIEGPIGAPPPVAEEKGSKFAIFKNIFSKKHEENKIAASANPTASSSSAADISTVTPVSSAPTISIEQAHNLQFKYAVLMNTEVEEVQNMPLFRAIDEWYGTPYVYGGSTHKGIDCSAFVQVIYAGLFGILLPRTALEQYKLTRPISRTELKQGDLLFFNTRGGISHVGIYLQNNKFVHAAVSGGVMISDLFDDYWVKRFIAAGRYESETKPASLSDPKP